MSTLYSVTFLKNKPEKSVFYIERQYILWNKTNEKQWKLIEQIDVIAFKSPVKLLRMVPRELLLRDWLDILITYIYVYIYKWIGICFGLWIMWECPQKRSTSSFICVHKHMYIVHNTNLLERMKESFIWIPNTCYHLWILCTLNRVYMLALSVASAHLHAQEKSVNFGIRIFAIFSKTNHRVFVPICFWWAESM